MPPFTAPVQLTQSRLSFRVRRLPRRGKSAPEREVAECIYLAIEKIKSTLSLLNVRRIL